MGKFQKVQEGLRRLFTQIQRPDNQRVREVVSVLKQVPMFQHLSGSLLEELAEVMHVREYRRDEFIYYERDPGLGFYLIQRGRVRLLIEDEQGSVHELRQLSKHEIFGRISVLGDFRRMETAQAMTDTRVLGFFRPDLKTLLKRRPTAGGAVLEVMARNLAVQQAALVRLLIEKEGKVGAMHLLDRVAAHTDAHPLDTSAQH